MPTLHKAVIKFNIGWDTVHCLWRFASSLINRIPPSISLNNLHSGARFGGGPSCICGKHNPITGLFQGGAHWESYSNLLSVLYWIFMHG